MRSHKQLLRQQLLEWLRVQDGLGKVGYRSLISGGNMSSHRNQIVIATYNVLADAYVKPEYFRHIDPSALKASVRYPRIVERVLGLGADIICLQEVEHELFRSLTSQLRRSGYLGRWAHKDGSKPDGVATFVKLPYRNLGARIVSLSDQSAADASGHVALITRVACGDARITVANVHLKWDQPNLTGDNHAGYAQARVLLDDLAHERPVIVCGDLNATSRSAILEDFRSAGFTDTHSDENPTCSHDGCVSKIDYILLRGGLHGEIGYRAKDAQIISVDAPVPSLDEPSDHIPVITTIEF
jgi:endonuclease/exonuclease/phosphatase family metal-dependent hydrolase